MSKKTPTVQPVESIKAMLLAAAEENGDRVAYKFRRGEEDVEVTSPRTHQNMSMYGIILTEK